MRPVPTENGGFRLEQITESEFSSLSHVPTDADHSTSPEAASRIFPPGFTGNPDPEDNADWSDYVHPDLQALFTDDLTHFANDLKSATKDDEDYSTIHVSGENAERWFRAFNQARLVMHSTHTFPEDEGDEDPMVQITALLQSGQFAPYLRSRIYAELQEWIVAHCLKY